MKARLLAVAVLAAAGFGLNALGFVKIQTVHGAGDEIQLLPMQIGAYYKSDQSWRNEPQPGVIEEGAMYSTGKGLPAQLDFFRHDPQTHNGLGCYLGQGETLLWERVQRLPTLNGTAEFDLGLAQTRETLRLVAASECRAGGCSEVPLPLWKQFSDFKRLIPQLFADPGEAVVPLSIVLTTPAANRDPALEAEMMRQMQSFIAALDLEPVRKLAVMQGGADAAAQNPTGTAKNRTAGE
jgi:hypothetical protein